MIKEYLKKKRKDIRKRYKIPLDKKVFVYGGNLGKPQDIPFIIECLKASHRITDAYFLIVGDGTEYGKLVEFIEKQKPDNVKLLKRLPKEEYDSMIAACDVGLIFLDHRFTIPNFPSRLLVYMQAGLPILAATDTNTDIGKVITSNGFGWWCKSDSVGVFTDLIEMIVYKESVCNEAELSWKYLKKNYSSSSVYLQMKEQIFHKMGFKGGLNENKG